MNVHENVFCILLENEGFEKEKEKEKEKDEKKKIFWLKNGKYYQILSY